MADEVFDGTDMVRQLFGEGEGVTDEAGDALSQRVVETLDVVGLPRVLRDGTAQSQGRDLIDGGQRNKERVRRPARDRGPGMHRQG